MPWCAIAAPKKDSASRPLPIPPTAPGGPVHWPRAAGEWRPGRSPLPAHAGMPGTVIAVAGIVGCLRRIQKSVRRWNRRGGRQGFNHLERPTAPGRPSLPATQHLLGPIPVRVRAAHGPSGVLPQAVGEDSDLISATGSTVL